MLETPQQRVNATHDAGPGLPRKGTVSAVRHAVEVLTALSQTGGPLGVSALARLVGRHKSTVSRILATLEETSLVERDQATGQYRLGLGLVALAGPLLRNLDVRKVARPLLEELARSCGETASLSLWDGQAAVIVEQILGNRAIAHVALPGRRVPAHCTAAGKVLLAHCPKVEREAVFAEGLKSYTPHSVTEPDALRRELERLRRDGYALNDQEYEAESCGAASPVYDRHGEVVAAVTVAVPKHRFGAASRHILFEHVRRAAAEASRHLGYREGPGDH